MCKQKEIIKFATSSYLFLYYIALKQYFLFFIDLRSIVLFRKAIIDNSNA